MSSRKRCPLVLGRNAHAARKEAGVGNKYLIERTSTEREIKARVDAEESGRCSGFNATPRCAPCQWRKAYLSVTSGRFGCAWQFRDTALGLDAKQKAKIF